MKITPNNTCPCGSHTKYKKCCKVFHNGASAKTALDLMKSRYSAYVIGDAKYIIKTTHPENKDYTEDLGTWIGSIKEFSSHSEFNGLVILDFIDGEEEAYVTFKALISQYGQDASFTEKSKFYRVDNRWLYHSGKFI